MEKSVHNQTIVFGGQDGVKMVERKVTIYIDGSCKGNPGPGTSLALFEFSDTVYGTIKFERRCIFDYTTNNKAEYDALLLALQELNRESKRIDEYKLDIKMNINIFTDSQLICGHLNKNWRINKNRDLVQKARVMIREINQKHNVTIKFVPREQNIAGVQI